jgi:hypothetical protein
MLAGEAGYCQVRAVQARLANLTVPRGHERSDISHPFLLTLAGRPDPDCAILVGCQEATVGQHG